MKKSDNACKGVARAPHRSLYYASGYTDEELNQPMVGIICAKKGDYENAIKILEAGKKMLLNLRDGIINNLSQLMSKIKEIPSKVKDWLVEGIQNLKGVGDNFVKGIWQGISDGLGWIKDKIKGWCGDVPWDAQCRDRWHTPSGAFREHVLRYKQHKVSR